MDEAQEDLIMKNQETKEKFIQLRAEGYSYNSIAQKLGVSKTTLLKWNVELKDEVNNAQCYYYQSLAEKFKLAKQQRINILLKELKKVNEALDKKDYDELSVKDLFNIQEKLETKLQKELSDMKLRTGEHEGDSMLIPLKMGIGKEVIIELE